METQFLVHDKADKVGVVVVENAKAGQLLKGHLLDGSWTFSIEATADIPLGHKIALGDIRLGDTVIEYGHAIGYATAAISRGGHVHVHNLKTKRW